MEIVVTGRNVEVPDHFRVHVAEKVERLERYDHKIVGLEVELFHERNRRQLKNCQRVEITGRGLRTRSRGPRRARRTSTRPDAAIAKLEARLRRSPTGAASPRVARRCWWAAAEAARRWLLDAPADVEVDLPGSPRRAGDRPPYPRATSSAARSTRPSTPQTTSRRPPRTNKDLDDEYRPADRPPQGAHRAPHERPTTRCRGWSSSDTTSTCSPTPRPGRPSSSYRRKGLRLRRDPPVALTAAGPASVRQSGRSGTPSALRRAPVVVSLPWLGRAPGLGAPRRKS